MIHLRVPGDKSVAHRFLILATLAEGESTLSGVPASLDVASTIGCLRELGAEVEDLGGGKFRVTGPAAWQLPRGPLDCGNSGTTARLLTGLIAGLGIEAELRGDPSLSLRPMDRVVYPLQAMGARISYVERADRLPVRLEGRASGGLRKLRYRPRVSSAQVRAALLLAALAGRTDLEILDRLRPRDHTERILRAMGAPVTSEPREAGEKVGFRGGTWNRELSPIDAAVPGDLSSAAFLVVAGLLTGRRVSIEGVGANPTRTGFLRVLAEMGARVDLEETGTEAGEPVGDLRVTARSLRPFAVDESLVPQLIDEVPALVALASRVEGVSVIRGASELRVKESDRLAMLVSNLRTLGVRCEELSDGLRVLGTLAALRGMVRSGGDHRIAMAFGALGVGPGCSVTVDDAQCVDVSFPGFWDALTEVDSGEGVQQ